MKSGDTTYYALRTEQLAWFSYYVNHSKDNKAANARLMADIDLSSSERQHLGQLDTDCIERFRICMECRLTGTLTATIMPSVICISTAINQGTRTVGYAGWQHPSAASDGRYPRDHGPYHAAVAGIISRGWSHSYCTSPEA